MSNSPVYQAEFEWLRLDIRNTLRRAIEGSKKEAEG